MRALLIVLVVLVIAAGALFGALNGARVPIGFYFTDIELPLGAALLGALLAGWLLGGLTAWLGQVPRLRRQLRVAQRALREARPAVDEGARKTP